MSLQKPQQLGCGSSGVMGSDRDMQSSGSSISLPSVKKAPKKRRISLASFFRRRRHESKNQRSREPQLPGSGGLTGVDGIASIESIHSEMCNDKSPAAISGTGTEGACATAASTSSASEPSSSTSASSCSKVAIGVGAELMECPLCLLRHSRESFPDIMTCYHRSCIDCLRQYLRIEILESRVNISCPECSERFNPHDICMILGDRLLMEKYEEFMLRRWLVADPDCRWCPAPDCGYAVIAFGCASCPKIKCGREGCGTEFCYHCKQLWHPNQTCDAARQQRAQSLRLRAVRSSSLSYSQESGAAVDDIKPCPRCAAYIIKMNDGSCNHMTCAVCGCEFCWLCMKEISDLHYLSPSGCTFWGKKPWSRKKKILWQLGTLVGAPVGIALIAGIAIPAMIIGIPVYVGRKIHNRYEGKDMSNHKRNLVITGGVTLSVIVSPVVAAVTVGIGVPIMLAYVYGVVPFSLCRSGGCGVSAGSGKGVRIEFDDENDMNAGSAATATDVTLVADTRNNPSIGEGSVGGMTGSLSASGSHMDHLGSNRDNLSDTASTMALAGASITGSLSGSAMVNYLNRLEVQADVQKERCSLSGESGTVSLGTVSDSASTKAMAGSILNSYIPLDRDGASMEVQVDVESKPGKQRHHSGGSSFDESSHAGRCGWTRPATSSEGKGTSSKWAKDASCSCSSNKKTKGKLRKKGGTKINESREDMDAQLLEQRSTNSSEFDSPSLSGSLPSVADSHSSHFSEFSSSDLESVKTSCSHGSSGGDFHMRFAAVSPLPEVENDRLESCPAPSTAPTLGNGAELPPLCFITEENVSLVCPAELDSHSDTGELLTEPNNNHHKAAPPLQSCCIQTDI
ncbi:E3 ubiquitin-protein ligase RNF19A [Oryzias melastigma]|uniref:RBR-type E3 ubiquitin transferase n=1 Tax=Oryzias melastigma TaxID=30732 RepID=A0A3B3CMH5_ORYME|nr:E3 ubiquitin-protein ligase RNF19A isoform X1 [Oryzias melastigma]XP_024136951.1 E3 ubiquitin-protein ligase RNF19A isoform X1 [Oryzias melastigma]KAF6716348.1 E3 ubiquitin-protein ligase RNF19A [Oryzias melastigma]